MQCRTLAVERATAQARWYLRPFSPEHVPNTVIRVKVLIITPSYYPCIGGLEVVVKEVTERLAQKGHVCSVFTPNMCGAKEEEEFNRVFVKRFSSRISKRLFGLSPEMLVHTVRNRRTFRTFDIVHIHGYWSLLTLQMIFLTKKVANSSQKIICSPYYHGSGRTKIANILHKMLLPFGKWMLRQVDAVICVSDYESSLLQRHLSVPREKIETIPIGVEKIERKRREKEKGNRISLLYVGRVVEYKGVQFVLSAMAKLKDVHHIDSSLTIVGEGAYTDELRKLIKQLSLEGAVTWRARLPSEALDKEYANADMLVLLSRMESYGLVVAEALAHGTPCIISKTSALTEFLDEPGCFGLDYPPDGEALANLIRQVNSKTVVGQLSRKVRVWDEVANDYLETYSSIIER